MDKKCSEFIISNKQKLLIKEIATASKVQNSNGRRYSQEWLMLCILVNIRSLSYYPFVRRNEILPCFKIVRDYLSVMGNSCGFDEKFFEILAKNFKTKDKFKCNGIIVVDEINLRKSVSVSSKNLTYEGIADFGDNLPKNDVKAENLETHVLVITLPSEIVRTVLVSAIKNHC